MFRLAILGHFPVDSPPQGGVQSVIANLRDVYAARDDIELHLIQHRRGIPDGAVAGDGFTMHNLQANEQRLVPNMMRTKQRLEPLLREIAPDAISTHQPEYALVAFDSAIPTVHTIHGFPANEFWTRRGVFTRTATLWEVWLLRQTLRRARHLIAISDHVIKTFQARTSAIFHRVNNPISPLFFEPGPSPEPHRLLLVGNLTSRKGVEVAIAAVARLLPDYPDLTLEIVGPAKDEQYAERLRVQAEPLGAAIEFSGLLSQSGIKRALGRAQALVLTSYEEHAPMVVAEAMACSRPVVATRVGGLSDMVEPGVTGYLAEAGDVTMIADGLQKLLADPEHAAGLGRNAARHARQRYHPEAVADGYLRAIEAAMEERTT
ncbi:MAG TPA: glycosyltransferase family 4 protein [Caldilineae bacterium]|nr:glycosyltransferase family 4 protein [Caldilineae bacterium]